MFDFTGLSGSTLFVNWRQFMPEQQNEFVSLFKDLLADIYADEILAYSDEKIIFTRLVQFFFLSLQDKADQNILSLYYWQTNPPIFFSSDH